jgi:hypothetical protein
MGLIILSDCRSRSRVTAVIDYTRTLGRYVVFGKVTNWHGLWLIKLYLTVIRSCVRSPPATSFTTDLCYQTWFSKSETGFMFINLCIVAPKRQFYRYNNPVHLKTSHSKQFSIFWKRIQNRFLS